MRGAKLLGEYLRERTRLTSAQVVEGLREQVISRDRGIRRRLGDILVERGYVSTEEVEEACARQRSELKQR